MATNITDLPYNVKTELPSRDIPRETIEHVVDPQINPIYVPPKTPEYIEQQPTLERKIDWMEELRLPIMMGLLYFLFDLPVLHLMLVKTAPTIFTDTTSGLLAKSLCFSLFYYAAVFGADYLNKN
jgi:hypothetical protein